jgi:hypothetical protein
MPARGASSTNRQSRSRSKSSKLSSKTLILDLFEAGKHHFLIVVDRYSGFPLVARLNSMTLESIIGHMEKMFFLLGRGGNQMRQRAML